jgi:hypothetical protein
MQREDDELMELKHDAEPGYRSFFYIVMTVAVSYLAFIFIRG